MPDWRAQLYNLSEDDLDTVVWRYLTFPKFVSMLSYGALWFCRLSYLTDKFEGGMPQKTIAKNKEQNDRWKSVFTSPEHHRQLDEMSERNVQDGRSLTTVNCWFIGEDESQRMWSEYVASTEGVAIRSTIRQVWQSVYLPSEISFIGRVNYIDFDEYDMSTYEGGQAHHRAFLKDRERFHHEQELRLETMNFRTPACLDPIGCPLPLEDVFEIGMNNFNEPGLHVRVKLDQLFDTIVTAPGAHDWFYNLIQHLKSKAGIDWALERSRFKQTNVEQDVDPNA